MSLTSHLPTTGVVASLALFGAVGNPPALANLTPLYDEIATYETTIPTTDDPADVYYPLSADEATERFPVVLMLQGAFVDKADYAEFASAVASYGFVVIVPNHERTVIDPRTGEEVTGFAAEQGQVNNVLNFLEMLEADPTSPLDERIDPEQFALVGHSLGGAVGISTIRGSCLAFLCASDRFYPPEELDAGVFFGTSFEFPYQSGTFPAIENSVPIALIAGSEDGLATAERVSTTYEQIQNPPKALIVVEGANHYGITNENNPDRALNPPLIDQDEAIATIAYWTGQFLRAYLWNDQSAFDAVFGIINSPDDGVTVVGEPGMPVESMIESD